jgi:hypothetical protein
MPKCSDSDDENDDDIPLANLFNIRNKLDQIGFTMDDLVNVDSDGRLRAKCYNKKDDINFPILNFPFICSNIPAAPVCGVAPCYNFKINHRISNNTGNTLLNKFTSLSVTCGKMKVHCTFLIF